MNNSNEARLKIAVFIDVDNISIGVKQSMNRNFDVGAVLEAIKEKGEIITKVAYGDWKRADDFSRAMTQHAIQMVQRNATPGGDKNGADIALALDALETAFTRPHINAFVIVGGDSDFIALVEKLKQYDKTVFVVGGRGFTSIILQKNCHEFISYENLVGAHTSRKLTGRIQLSSPATLKNAMPLVRRALKILSDREVSPQLGLLKSTLLQLDSTFSERDYGVGSFRDFVQKLADAGYINLKQVDRSILVEMKESFKEQENAEDAVDLENESAETTAEIKEPSAAPAETASADMDESHVVPAETTRETAETTETGEAGEAAATVSAENAANMPTPLQSTDAGAALEELFRDSATKPHWPLYVRTFKQFLRAQQPPFDERQYGISSTYDLARQAQREGLFHIERNRQGILRIFPGERFPKPAQGVEEIPAEISPEISSGESAYPVEISEEMKERSAVTPVISTENAAGKAAPETGVPEIAVPETVVAEVSLLTEQLVERMETTEIGIAENTASEPADSSVVKPKVKPRTQRKSAAATAKASKSATAAGKTQNAPGKTQNAPGKTQNAPDKTQNAPGKTQNAPGKTQNAPGKTQNVPSKTQTTTKGKSRKKKEE